MKVRCPYCEAEFDLEAYLKDSIMVQVIRMLPDFGPHSRLAWEYAELFGIRPPLNARKLYRVLAEVREIFIAQAFDFQKRRYEISREGLVQAMRTVCNQLRSGRPGGSPLQNHNYLKKVAIGIAEGESTERSRQEEKNLRTKEKSLKTGDPQITQISQIQDLPGKVKDLLGRIG